MGMNKIFTVGQFITASLHQYNSISQSLGQWPSQPQVVSQLAGPSRLPSSRAGLKSNQKVVGYSHNNCSSRASGQPSQACPFCSSQATQLVMIAEHFLLH